MMVMKEDRGNMSYINFVADMRLIVGSNFCASLGPWGDRNHAASDQ